MATKTKQHTKPIALVHKFINKKELCRMEKAVENMVVYNYYKPNVKK